MQHPPRGVCFVLVESHYAVREINSGIYGAMALDEHPSHFKNTNILKITDDGFTVYSQKINDNPRYAVLNFINMDYYYQCVGDILALTASAYASPQPELSKCFFLHRHIPVRKMQKSVFKIDLIPLQRPNLPPAEPTSPRQMYDYRR